MKQEWSDYLNEAIDIMTYGNGKSRSDAARVLSRHELSLMRSYKMNLPARIALQAILTQIMSRMEQQQ